MLRGPLSAVAGFEPLTLTLNLVDLQSGDLSTGPQHLYTSEEPFEGLTSKSPAEASPSSADPSSSELEASLISSTSSSSSDSDSASVAKFKFL